MVGRQSHAVSRAAVSSLCCLHFLFSPYIVSNFCNTKTEAFCTLIRVSYYDHTHLRTVQPQLLTSRSPHPCCPPIHDRSTPPLPASPSPLLLPPPRAAVLHRRSCVDCCCRFALQRTSGALSGVIQTRASKSDTSAPDAATALPTGQVTSQACHGLSGCCAKPVSAAAKPFALSFPAVPPLDQRAPPCCYFRVTNF
jgi:hypothetical protein